MDGNVKVTIEDGIATVCFYHPQKNSLPGKLLRNIATEINNLGTNKDVTVIILKSDGEGPFCAGASFDELASIQDFATGKHFFLGFAHIILAMKKSPKLVIARVQGKTVGGGVGLACAADYTLATNNASVKLSELAVGIGPFVVGPAVARKVGISAFADLSIDTDWRSAEWCKTHGLYANTFDTISELDTAVIALAQKLAKSNPEAMAGIKRVLWAGTENWDQLLDERAEISGKLVLSDFTKNAIAAFKKNRGV